MIYDILSGFDTALVNGTNGLNAKITAVNTAKSTTVPLMTEILVWNHHKLPTAMSMPTALLLWERSTGLELKNQSKWRGEHYLSLQFWTNEKTGSAARKDIAIWAAAARSFLEYAVDNVDGIDEIRDVAMFTSGWGVAGKLFTWLGVSFRVKERDENPV